MEIIDNKGDDIKFNPIVNKKGGCPYDNQEFIFIKEKEDDKYYYIKCKHNDRYLTVCDNELHMANKITDPEEMCLQKFYKEDVKLSYTK